MTRIFFFTCLALAFALAAPLADAASFHRYGALALNRSGTRLASLESTTDSVTGQRSRTVVSLRNAQSGNVLAQFDPCAKCSYDQPAFSRKDDSLAFVATDSSARKAYLYVVRNDEVRLVYTIDGIASGARFSPDGRALAFLATVNARKLAGAVAAGARQVGEIGRSPDEQRLALVDIDGGNADLISPADTYVYAYDWTPDGRGFAVVSAVGDGDKNFWVAKLNYLDLHERRLRTVAAPAYQMNRPKVSPDGRQVAFIGGLMSDFDTVTGDVYTVPLSGGVPVNLTKGSHASYNAVHWGREGLLASGIESSDAVLDRIGQGRTVRKVWRAQTAASAGEGGFTFADGADAVATVLEDFTHPPRIEAGPPARFSPITHDNDQFGAQVSAQSIVWKSDGFQVQGWLLSPLKRDAGKLYPMIVSIHGGPANATTPRYVADAELANPTLRAIVGAGYFLFLPNPRGSMGQGQAFTRANRNDFGGGDWRDIERGVDAVLAQAPVDPQRLGITGHSYGGFMTMWAVTHSQRYKAAVASAGIANWVSYYGQNGINQWMIPYFGASAYDAPARYRRASPMESIKSAKTPTLILVGEADLECPPAQSLEFWNGLQAMGIPTQLYIYENEGHGIRQPEHQRDQRQRLLTWFDRYLQP